MTDTDRLSAALHGVESAHRPGADGVQVLRDAAQGTIIHTLDYGPVDQRTALGLGIELLHMEDGTIRIAHDCKLIGDDRRLRIAFLLDPRHIVTPEPVTITPSILCDDCGLHGWVIAGEWSPA